jgi:hypothetical protein
LQWKAATGRKKKRNYRKQQNGSSKFLPVITLYENGLNSPMRRHGVTEWILKDKKKKIIIKTKLRTNYMLPTKKLTSALLTHIA